MPRCRAPVRRGDARAAIFIILGLGLFAMVGLILAVLMLASVRRSTTSNSTPPLPRPVGERFGGLLAHGPPDADSITAVDVAALHADLRHKEVADLVTGPWQRSHEKRFGKVPFTAADVDAFVSLKTLANAEQERGLPAQDRRGVLTAIRFNRPVTVGEILRGVVAGNYKTDDRIAKTGERYHVLFRVIDLRDHTEREDDVSLRLVDDRTLLLATTRREMEESMRRTPGRVELAAPLHRMIERSDGTVLIAAVRPVGPGDSDLTHFRSFRTPASRTIRESRAGSIWFRVDGDQVEYHEGFLMPDGPRAAALRDALVTEFANGASEFAATARVNTTGDLVTVDTIVGRERFIQALKDETVPPGPKSK